MFIDVQHNILPVDVMGEDRGYVYGDLRGPLPFPPVIAERHRNDPDAEGSVSYLQHLLFTSGFCFHQLPKEALAEFINLEEGNAKGAIEYVRRYGISSLFDLRTPNLPRKIQAHWSYSRDNGRVPFAVALNYLWQHRRMLANPTRLAAVIARPDEEIAKSLLIRQGYPEQTSNLYGRSWVDSAKGTLQFDLMIQLQRVIVGPTSKHGKLVPAMASYGFGEALALLILDDIHLESPLGECRNPQCKKLFFRSRGTKQYCSERCQALIKVHRSRAKAKQEKERLKKKARSRTR